MAPQVPNAGRDGDAAQPSRRVPQRSMAVFQTHDPGAGTSLGFSADGAELLTAGADCKLKVHAVLGASASAGDPPGKGGAGSAGEALGIRERLCRADHSKGISAVAVSPLGDVVATAGLDHAVKLYRYPSGRFESTVTRFTLPIRALGFSASGGMLAAAGDDEGIKLISTLDCSIAAILKGHDAPVLSVAFDPKNEFLASSDADGTVTIWNIAAGKAVHVLRDAAPAVADVDTCAQHNTVAWHPDGGLLAVPAAGGVVKCYDRDTAEEMLSLEGEHSGHVAVLAWSPSGRYLASAADDGQILVWDAEEQQDLNTARLDGAVCALAWCPRGNLLAACTADGSTALWTAPVPGHMPLPSASHLPASTGGKLSRDELLKFDNDGDDFSPPSEPGQQMPGEAGHLEELRQREQDRRGSKRTRSPDGGEDSEPGEPQGSDGEAQEVSRGARHRWAQEGKHKDGVRGHGGRQQHGSGGEEVEGEQARRDRHQHKHQDKHRHRDSRHGGPERRGDAVGATAAIQAPFQPGSTPEPSWKPTAAEADPAARPKRFLAFNLLGCITSRADAEFAHIEVEFHDTSAMPCRVPALVDYYGFSQGALSTRGCVLASPAKPALRQPSTLLFRPFSSWASNSDWTVRLPGEEEVCAVALGQRWVAACTSLHMLRIFSETGIQRFVLSLPGPVVTMAGQGSSLAVVSHAAPAFATGSQCLEVSVFDVPRQLLRWRAQLPLSPGATLSWLGFSAPASSPSSLHPPGPHQLSCAAPQEDGMLTAYDSTGVVRVYREEFGGCWVPVFSSVAERKSGVERHWMVGLDISPRAQRLYFVVCKAPDAYPQVFPRPVLSELKMSIPLLVSDVAASEPLENSLLQTTMHISQVRRQLEQAVVQGREAEAQEQEDALGSLELEMDKTTLRLLSAACKGDKLERAVELGGMLVLRKSLEGAVRLASALRLPVLAERLHTMLQERKAMEEAQQAEPVGFLQSSIRRVDAPHPPLRSDDSWMQGQSARPGKAFEAPERQDPGHAVPKPETPQPKSSPSIQSQDTRKRLEASFKEDDNTDSGKEHAGTMSSTQSSTPEKIPKENGSRATTSQKGKARASSNKEGIKEKVPEKQAVAPPVNPFAQKQASNPFTNSLSAEREHSSGKGNASGSILDSVQALEASEGQKDCSAEQPRSSSSGKKKPAGNPKTFFKPRSKA